MNVLKSAFDFLDLIRVEGNGNEMLSERPSMCYGAAVAGTFENTKLGRMECIQEILNMMEPSGVQHAEIASIYSLPLLKVVQRATQVHAVGLPLTQ